MTHEFLRETLRHAFLSEARGEGFPQAVEVQLAAKGIERIDFGPQQSPQALRRILLRVAANRGYNLRMICGE